MAKSGKMYLDATEDDMGSKLTKSVKFMRYLVENDPKMSVNDAVNLGWATHDMHASIDRLNAFAGDLSVVSDDIDVAIARLTKLSAKAQGKK